MSGSAIETQTPGSIPAPTGNSPQPLKVLVVDDEPLIRWSLRKRPGPRGHRRDRGGHAAEALRLIRPSPDRFDVVILDYRLPDRQDLTLLQEVRRSLPQRRCS